MPYSAFGGVAASDIYSGSAIILIEVALIVSVFLNRKGHVNTAGTILVSTILIGISITFLGWGLTRGGVSTDMLPDFDYLAAAAILAATTLPPRSTFVVMVVITVEILLVWNFLPHSGDLLLTQATYPSPLIAAGTLVGRPIGFDLLFALLAYYVVQGYNQASIRMYTAMSIAEDRTDLAAAMQRTAQEQEMIQHYQDIFFTAIARYVSDRTQGIINSIALNFRRPQSALEEHTQLRVAAEARRLNTFFKRLDTQEERRIWDIRQIMSALRNYNYILSMILEHPERADIGTIHPKRTIHTNNSTIDTMFSLIFATVAGAEPWHLLTKSQLQFTNPAQYVETTRRDALEDYHHANRGNPPSRDSAPLQQQPVSYPDAGMQSSPFGPSYPPTPPQPYQTSPQMGELPPEGRRSASRGQPHQDAYDASAGHIAQANRPSGPSWGAREQDEANWPSLNTTDDHNLPPWIPPGYQSGSEPWPPVNPTESDQYSSRRPASERHDWT